MNDIRTEPTASAKRKKGILCLIISAFSFALMSMFISLAGDMPVFQKALFRNLVALALSIILLLRSPEKFRIQKGSMPGLLMRASFGTLGLICNFYAISKINIADALILNKLSPFFAVIASIIILREVANIRQWFAISVALIGALFVVKPEFLFANTGNYDQSHIFPAVIGIVGGITAGIAYTFLRKLRLQGERGTVIVAFFSAFSCIAVVPFIIATYEPVTPIQLLFCLCAGVAACSGQLFITAAYGACPAKEISVYDYSTVIFAAVLGMLFLGEFPDTLSILGYIIIIAASVYAYLVNNGIIPVKKNADKTEAEDKDE